jgi:hypothetical protein
MRADARVMDRGHAGAALDEGGVMQRLAVIAKLRPGAAAEAAKLIELGPPFDPPAHEVERHTVFLAPYAAVFVFEGGHVSSLLASLSGEDEQSVLAAWEPLLDGTPMIAREAYHWIGPDSRGPDEGWGQ